MDSYQTAKQDSYRTNGAGAPVNTISTGTMPSALSHLEEQVTIIAAQVEKLEQLLQGVTSPREQATCAGTAPPKLVPGSQLSARVFEQAERLMHTNVALEIIINTLDL